MPRCQFIYHVSCELKLEKEALEAFQVVALLVVWDKTSEMSVVIFQSVLRSVNKWLAVSVAVFFLSPAKLN